MKTNRFLSAAIIIATTTVFAQTTDPTGDYCKKEKDGNVCYQFKANNSVTLSVQKIRFLGSYTIDNNNINIALTGAENKNAFVEWVKELLRKNVVAKQKERNEVKKKVELTCKLNISVRDYRWGRTVQECMNDLAMQVVINLEQENIDAQIKALNEQIKTLKYEDVIEKTMNGLGANHYFIAGNLMFELDEKCNSKATYIKGNAKSTEFSLKNKQFCVNGKVYNNQAEAKAKLHLQQIYDEHKNVKKGEFESTADFNKRKAELDSKLKDSTESYFYSALNSIVDSIRDNRAFDFNLVKYDADKQIYEIVFKKDGLEIKGKVKMSSEVAQKIKGNMKEFSFTYDDVNLETVDYELSRKKCRLS